MIARLAAILLLCLPLAAQQPATTPATPPKLTIESIFAENGITGRGPEAIKWSPDSTRLSFIQRDDAGEHGQLWWIDVATGSQVGAGRGEQAAIAVSAVQPHDRRTARARPALFRRRLPVGARLQAPAFRQPRTALVLLSRHRHRGAAYLGGGTHQRFQVLARRKAPGLFAQARPLVAPGRRGRRAPGHP